MAFFKFRLPGQKSPSESSGAAPTESVDAMRQRAKHRLIGAAVLVGVGVVAFPLLFDTQPRPVAVDIPIDIPDKNKAKPLVPPPAAVAAKPVASEPASKPAPVVEAVKPPVAAAKPAAPATPAGKLAATSGLDEREQLVRPEAEAKPKAVPAPAKPAPAAPKKDLADAKPADKPASKLAPSASSAKEAAKEPVKEPAKAAKGDAPRLPQVTADALPREVKDTARADDGAKARALLDGAAPPEKPADKAPVKVDKPADKAPEKAADKPAPKASAAAADSGRFIVQVGAFSEQVKAREARLKVEAAGLKTYTQVVDTGEGRRIRVRVGPFASRAEADKAAGRIKALHLPAAILTL